MDVKKAFYQNEEFFVSQPKGFENLTMFTNSRKPFMVLNAPQEHVTNVYQNTSFVRSIVEGEQIEYM